MSNIIYNPSINHKTENDDLNFNEFADVEVLPSSIEGSLSQGNKLISDIIHYGIVSYIGLFLYHVFLGGGGGMGRFCDHYYYLLLLLLLLLFYSFIKRKITYSFYALYNVCARKQW